MAETMWDKADSVIYNIVNDNIKDAKRVFKSQSRKQRYITISCMQDDDRISKSYMWEWIKIAVTGEFN